MEVNDLVRLKYPHNYNSYLNIGAGEIGLVIRRDFINNHGKYSYYASVLICNRVVRFNINKLMTVDISP